MYFHGDIIEQNHALAYAWLLIAAENADEVAKPEVLEYEKNVETAREYSMKEIEEGKVLSQQIKTELKGGGNNHEDPGTCLCQPVFCAGGL